jgi:hypothetical protein
MQDLVTFKGKTMLSTAAEHAVTYDISRTDAPRRESHHRQPLVLYPERCMSVTLHILV